MQPPGGARLAHQPAPPGVILALGANQLDRDRPIDQGIAGEIHFAHSSSTEESRHLEAADRRRDDAGGARRLRRRPRQRDVEEETLGGFDVASQRIAGQVVLQQRLDLGAERLRHLPAEVVVVALRGGEVGDLAKERGNVGTHTCLKRTRYCRRTCHQR